MGNYLYYLTKLILTSLIIVVVTEVAKVNAYVGGLIKSLPLISLIAIIWLYAETRDPIKVADLSIGTFWFVLPTLPMFLILQYLLKNNVNFYISLIISIVVMLVGYGITILILRQFGYKF